MEQEEVSDRCRKNQESLQTYALLAIIAFYAQQSHDLVLLAQRILLLMSLGGIKIRESIPNFWPPKT